MYKSKLSINDTQKAIGIIKSVFPEYLAKELSLTRATSPLFVDPRTGLNDGLNGELPVSFSFKGDPTVVEVVHSLAKWKRYSLKHYQYPIGTGLYADMNAIRREEEVGPMHSYYVDQWDWEKAIDVKDRTYEYLQRVVRSIYAQVKRAEYRLKSEFDELSIKLPEKIQFISTQELEDLYPNLTPKEREHTHSRKVKAFFLTQVGWELKSGKVHDSRAFDYDDWNLNGDIIVYHPTLDKSIELSSMGIRVDAEAMRLQARKAHKLSFEDLMVKSPYHKSILEAKLPYSIGGGIGQSRLCMFLLEKAHVGEVQASYWPEKEILRAEKEGIFLL
ncbi:aspartate-ammonia ligase [Mycoplasma testudineum]|uniref:Aspartate-ammonia ligase n=1 Tax=Mycoplasma testudineum TaxID=244584 RepID=A0A4R6IJD2_9MOLU|nr:aspartate--ammonia ligase [Mycoplasma testudineum]OYD26426.1 aspartate--ammonia ligase [Mycoplasma testudineum]TDO22101.1 aspartate-ammonia ligase [Mycoplasma testudineum]